MADFFTWLSNAFTDILNVVLLLLPKSPFVYLDTIPAVSEVLGYVNYFIPLSSMVVVGEMWLIAIGFYYIVQVALRWIKAVD